MAVGNFEIADLLVGTVCPEHGYLARSTEAPAIVGGDEFFAPEADLQRGGSTDSRSEQPASQLPILLRACTIQPQLPLPDWQVFP